MEIRNKKTYSSLEELLKDRFCLFGTDIYIKFKFSEIPESVAIQLKVQNNDIIMED